MSTKEKHLESYNRINKGYYTNNDILNYKKLIEEHFNNPHLKFEELKEGMWVWDNCWCEWFEISEVYQETKEFDILIHQNAINKKRYETIKFEENRFYRKEVKDDEKRKCIKTYRKKYR